ncbi:unnamed protein product [Heligmosomoides polygyrus]|uniref:Sema domain-containing protein n=1 Tax=Heligmosomoides polygyrus TaxID=6339 RepID=A0A183F8E1_HELPZ|nr:unnamed protein product [Heligmosomoides polygyrus]
METQIFAGQVTGGMVTCPAQRQRIYSYYWLSDRSAVLLDYSKREGSVRQNLLCFDHDEKAVSCNIIRHVHHFRNHDFNVESMCYSRDFTAQKLILPQGEFLLLCGYRHFEDGVFFRLVPYYPYMDISLPTDEFVIDTPSIIRSLTGDVLLHTGGHPFVYGTTMTFLLYREDLSETTYYINYTLQIDLGKALNANERRITSSQSYSFMRSTFQLFSERRYIPHRLVSPS